MKKILLCSLVLATTMLSAKDLKISIYTDVTGFDPHDTSATPSYSVQSGIFERLFGFDKDMKIIPVLAKSYSANDDATQFTIELKEGITFQDGEPFNATAAKVNLDRLANQDLKLKRNSLFKMVDQVKIINDYKIEIDLKEPFGAMISTLAHPSAVMQSPKSLQNDEQTIRTHPVGTGPFKLVSWKQNREIKLVKNEHYWREGYPKVDTVTFYPTPEASTRVAKLKAGEVDAVYFLPSDLAKTVETDKKLALEEGTGIMQFFVALNNQKKQFADKRVRQAINYAVNKNIWLKIVFGGKGNVAISPLPPKVQFHEKQKEAYNYNLAKAKELMKEAGYEKGFSVELWSSDATDSVRTAQIIKQQLAKINIKVKIVPMDGPTRTERLWKVKNPKDAKFDMYVGGWSTSTGDADWALRPQFATESWIPTAYNTSYYSNPEVDQAIQKALSTPDPKVRFEAYKKAQQLIWDDQPVIFLGEPDNLVGKVKNLTGVYMLPDRSLVYSDAEFK